MNQVVDRTWLLQMAATHVEPEDNADDLEEATKQAAEESDEQIVADLEVGIGPFAKLKPREQQAAFEQVTLVEDVDMLMHPDFLKYRELLGLRLYAEDMRDQLLMEQQQAFVAQLDEQASIASETGPMDPMMQQPPPMPTTSDVPFLFWPTIMECRKVVREKMLSEFRKAMKAMAKREMSMVEPGLEGPAPSSGPATTGMY